MKKIIFLFILLNLFQNHCYSQKQGQAKIDSLILILKTEKQDTAEVITLNALSSEFQKNNNPDTGIYFANEALTLATKLDYKMGIADAHLKIGTGKMYIGKFEEAVKNCNDALNIYDQLLTSGKTGEKSELLKRKADAFYTIGGVIYGRQGNYSEELKNYSEALKLYEAIGDKKSEANVYLSIGNIYYSQGSYPEALKNYSTCLKIREELGDKKGVAATYENIANIYLSKGSNAEAMNNYLAALKIYEELGDKPAIAMNYFNIGIIYNSQGNNAEALKNYSASLKIEMELGDKNRIALSYYNIGSMYELLGNFPEALKNLNVSLEISKEIGSKEIMGLAYSGLGILYFEQGNIPEGLKNLLSALKISEETGNKPSIADLNKNIGGIYASLINYPEALKHLFAALKIFKELDDKQGMAAISNSIAAIYNEQKKYREAYIFLEKGLSLAKEIGSIEDIKESYLGLSKVDSAQGDYKHASEHFKLYIANRDSLVNEESTRKIVQAQMQYDFDKKELLTKAEQEKKNAIALKELQKQKLVRNGFVGGFAIVLLFAGVFFTQRNRIVKEKKISDKEKKRSEELLLNILPYEVAEELKTTGKFLAKTYSLVTVMFADFKDFTSVSEKVSAELLVAEINFCFSAFDNILQKHRVEKIKTVGDAYICAAGLPVLNYTHSVDLVNAAIEIRNFMLNRKIEKDVKGEISFQLRIGIHTGPVVAGIVGVKKFQYDIWGDTVNIAARMESSCEAGKVNVSGSTYELVKNKFTCTHRGKIEAKNKGEIDMYYVENIS